MRGVSSGVRTAGLLAATLLASEAAAAAARLYPETITAWQAYVSATEGRIASELRSSHGFLVLDSVQDAALERRAVASGAIVVQRMETLDAAGRAMEVPGALVHHWRGAALIPGVRVAELMATLEHGVPLTGQEEVLQSRVLERGPGRMRVYLKLQRRKFVTSVYDTEHLVTFTHYGPARAASASIATKIVELAEPGTPRERELPPGDDRGFLWRLNAYWRYEDVPGGAIAECESIALSRDVPSVVRYLVSPLIESTARESMERTLLALRARLGRS